MASHGKKKQNHLIQKLSKSHFRSDLKTNNFTLKTFKEMQLRRGKPHLRFLERKSVHTATIISVSPFPKIN